MTTPKGNTFIEYTVKFMVSLELIEAGDARLSDFIEDMRGQGAAEVIDREFIGEMTWDEAWKKFRKKYSDQALTL